MTEQKDDLAQIAEVVNWYFNGMYQSDGALLKRAFHPKAKLSGHTDGKFVEMELEGFAKFAAKQPSAEAAGEPFEMRIVSIDVTGLAAIVKVADIYIGRKFTDYLSLLKIDGKWQIYNKLWHTEGKAE